MRASLLAGTFLVTGAMAASAADVALVIGNESYQNAQDVRNGDEPTDAAGALQEAGFLTSVGENVALRELRALAADFAEAAVSADGALAVLSGRFVHTSTDTYFLPVDSGAPTLAGLPGQSLPLSTVMAVLANHPGRAMLVLASDGADGSDNVYLTEGVGELNVPQGVIVVRGPTDEMEDFLEDVIARPNMSVAAAIDGNDDLEGEGFLPMSFAFLTDRPAPMPEPQPAPRPVENSVTDAEAWTRAEQADSEVAYRLYLDLFPRGSRAAEARARIEEIRNEPTRDARLAEEGLSLTREQQRNIQRDLVMLDYDTRGIDGIFGPGTRGAISNWQRDNRFEATGFLTNEQITRLDGQAERRSAELEAEAEARRAEQERLDRAYWDETGAAGDEPGLRAYLTRYPDGLFADVAQERLDAIEAEKRNAAAADDRAAWEEANAEATIRSYNSYLNAYPSGAFADMAQARIAEIESENSSETQAALEVEQSLGLTPVTRTAVENRLAALELEPGPVDGEFDDATRRAIRRYQRGSDLPVTGYLDQDTVVRLLADSVRSLFR